MKNSNSVNYWPWYFGTAAIESLIALIVLVRIPSEAGISPARLGLAGILVFFCVSGILMTFRHRDRDISLRDDSLIYLAGFATLASGLTLFFLRYLDPVHLLPFYIRVQPVLMFIALLGMESVFFFLFIRNGLRVHELKNLEPTYKPALIAFAVLLFVLLGVVVTKLGITRDPAYWGEPGVPLLGWQVALAIIVGIFVLLINQVDRIRAYDALVKVWIPLAIWLIACFSWLSVPVNTLQNSFYSPITPPANIPYPYSDAGTYDSLAQSLLIGEGYQNGVPPRPFYIIFLTALHLIFNQDYIKIITAQSAILALFPLALYFLGKNIHTVGAGVVVALLAIFREVNTLWVASNTRVVNTKILTTDYPTALGISFLCLLLLYWFQSRTNRSALICGGAFGLFLLLRTQSIVILPLLLLMAFIIMRRPSDSSGPDLLEGSTKIKKQFSNSPKSSGRTWLTAIIIFILGMLLAITPWLVHNFTVLGRFAFDDPNQMGIIYSQYAFTGNLEFSQFDIKQDNLVGSLLKFTIDHPAFVAGFMTNHFLNTEIGSLLALPLIERFDGLFEPQNLYWLSWDGSITWNNLLLLIGYLMIIAVGLGASWNRWKLLGFTPLAFNIGYALSNGISRFSSWRYNLPVDWVAYFYFGIGAMEVVGGLAILFGSRISRIISTERDNSSITNDGYRHSRSALGLIAFAIILFGSLPWIAKLLFEHRYTLTNDALVGRLVQSGLERYQITAFLATDNAVLEEGRLLYPRFYRRDLGLSSTTPWPVYAVRDFPRLGFVLLNQANIQVIYPTREPLPFQHGEDVIVLGCQWEDYLEARFILFTELAEQYSLEPILGPCK